MAVCCICDVQFGLQGEWITFHRFPKDEDKKVHWITAIDKKIKNFSFTSSSQICSRHFTMECFVITCSGKRYLKTNAVPSIFNIPLKQELELVQPVQQQLYTQSDNVASMDHKPEEAKILKTVIKPINNKYLYKSNSTKAAGILESNAKIDIPHSASLPSSLAVNNTEEATTNDLQHAREYIETLKKKLKVSQQKCRRLQTRVIFLKLLVKHLQNKKQ